MIPGNKHGTGLHILESIEECNKLPKNYQDTDRSTPAKTKEDNIFVLFKKIDRQDDIFNTQGITNVCGHFILLVSRLGL